MAKIKLNEEVENGLLHYWESGKKGFFGEYTEIKIWYTNKGDEEKTKLIKIKFVANWESGYNTPIPNREKIESFKKRLDTLIGKRIMRGYHQV